MREMAQLRETPALHLRETKHACDARVESPYLNRMARTGVMLETTKEGSSKKITVMSNVPMLMPATAIQLTFTGAYDK